MKRGQVTIFIIVAVIAILTLILFFTIPEPTNEAEKAPLQDVVDGCLFDVGYNSLETIRTQGGYYNKPKRFYDVNNAFVPYYYYEGEYLSPNKEEVEEELSTLVGIGFSNCLNNYDGSYDIEQGKTTVSSKIDPSSVHITVDSRVTFSKADQNIVIQTKNDPLSLPSKLHDMLEVAQYITESHKVDPEMYCINCLDALAKEKELFVYNFEIEENIILMVISENTSIYSRTFEFLNKYTGDEISPDLTAGQSSNNPPLPSDE